MTGHLLLLHIAGGVALLIWATRMVRTGITRAYGAELRRVLGRSTRNRVSACVTGIGAAGLLQSSTATALLAVSFAGRGLVNVAAGLAVMLGADIGSTLVIQVLSFDISALSPVLILVGVVSFLAGPTTQWRHLGRVGIGLGLMLLALTLVVGASQPLRDSTALQYVLRPLSGDPIIALLLAAVITWIAHSSVAIVLLVMSLTAVGVVPLTLGFALVLGANVGSGIVPVLLTASGDPVARRIPLGNLLFRTLGAVAVLPLIAVLAPYVELLGSDPARQIANFHSLFNVALAAACLPFVGAVDRILAKLLPEPAHGGGPFRPKYLDPATIDTPSIAIACATREVMRMADTVETMLRGVIEVFETNSSQMIDTISALDDEVDALHESIKLYLASVTRNALADHDGRRCVDLISFTTNLEHIGDIIDKNLLETARKKIRNRLSFSDQGWRELRSMHSRAMHQMQLAMSVLVSGDVETARQLLTDKERFRELELEGSQKHLERLRSGQLESIETSALHLDILRDLKRINSHLTSIAYPILEASGELRHSRLVGQPETGPEPEPNPAAVDKASAGR